MAVLSYYCRGLRRIASCQQVLRRCWRRSYTQPRPPAASPTKAGVTLPLLTQVSDIRQLTPDQAVRGYLVRLRAVVTYSDSAHNYLSVQDSTAEMSLPAEDDAALAAAAWPVKRNGHASMDALAS